MVKKKYTHIIWDWNGTLFDDVEWCVKTINTMLARRGLPPLGSVEEYREIFCFPVAEYYKKLGFDFEKEPFEKLAVEYMDLYHTGKSGGCGLYGGAEAVLRALCEAGKSQIILSASETLNLSNQVDEFDIRGYFDEIIGISDIYAKSKIHAGIDYMARKAVSSAVLIGDTCHDYETARSLGADCLLIASGHQSRARLEACGVPVLGGIGEVLGELGIR